MLSIKQKQGKKNRALKPSNFDLYLGKSRVTGDKVSSSAVISQLEKYCNNIDSKPTGKAPVAEAEAPEQVVRFHGSRIMDSFKWAKKAGSRFIIDADSFKIRNEYLPKDDNAPQRLYEIAQQICDMYDTYYQEKAKLIDIATAECQKIPEGTYNIAKSAEESVLTQVINGEFIPVTGNCKVKDVVITMFWVENRAQVEFSKAAMQDITVPAHGEIPELTFKVTNSGGITADTSNLSGEVLHMFEQLHPILSPTKEKLAA